MSAARYRSGPADHIARRDLGELVALFHRPSGQTHLVTSPVPEILDALAQGEASLAELRERLAARYDLDGGRGDGGERDALGEHVERLAALGLICRA